MIPELDAQKWQDTFAIVKAEMPSDSPDLFTREQVTHLLYSRYKEEGDESWHGGIFRLQDGRIGYLKATTHHDLFKPYYAGSAKIANSFTDLKLRLLGMRRTGGDEIEPLSLLDEIIDGNFVPPSLLGIAPVPAATARLSFRELNANDAQAVHLWTTDPAVCKFLEWGPNTLEDTQAFVQRCEQQQADPQRSIWTFGLIRKEDGQLIGSCSIRADRPRQMSIGYTLRRDVWGQGYATEAARSLIAFGFTEFKLHRIWATCRPANQGSVNVLLKAGMRYEGTMLEDRLIRGVWEHSRLYAIVEDEWPRTP